MSTSEYTDESPIDVASEEFDALAALIATRCIAATSDLGEFGVTLGAHTDGTIEVGFGPNMTVNWDAVRAEASA